MRYVLALVSAIGIASACGGNTTAPAEFGVGSRAPDAQVTTTKGTQVALAESWKGHAKGVIVFYRGFY